MPKKKKNRVPLIFPGGRVEFVKFKQAKKLVEAGVAEYCPQPYTNTTGYLKAIREPSERR